MGRLRSAVGLALASLLFTSGVSAQEEAAEEIAHPVSLGGSFFSRYELRSHYAQAPGLTSSDAIRTRARLLVQSAPISIADHIDLTMRFAPQAAGFWHVGGNSLEDASLGLHEGLLVIQGNWIRTEVGRFEMVYGDHLVIGNVGWHHVGRAFDGFRLRYTPIQDNRNIYVDAFATTLTEGLVEGPFGRPIGSGDQYFFGVYSGFGPALAEGLNLDAYLLARAWPASNELDSDVGLRTTFGVRAKGNAGVMDYRVETGVQFGSVPGADPGLNSVSVFAYQGDVELGVNLVDNTLRFAVEGLIASGDDPDTEDNEAWDQLFPTAHKWLGYMDVFGGRTNVMSGVFHTVYKAMAALRFTLDTHMFQRAFGADGDSQFIGTEVDVGAVWTIGRGLRLRGGYGVFIPDEEVGDDSLHFIELELRYDLAP